ncbi:leucine-rich repeat-containing protein 70 [Copidosoma floridanum]|uniref:leucine-rich repeat-containing protein 70 n=1 Tax=Copidosoma floridanum TaxID=29053 RepID=UPI0006C9BCB9|nr:leucine-rich repeat-containing protein 70 [Copidosoma floridanum]
MCKITYLAIVLLYIGSGTNGCFYDTFNGLRNTNTLRFSSALLPHLSERFVTNEAVEYVILQNNGIKSIADGAFSGLPRMKVLDLSNNNLLPKDFFAFGHHKNVEAIIFDDNFHENASSTDLEIKISHNYPKLKFLSLRNVGLKTISPELSIQFFGLSHLDLSRNNLNHKDVFTYLPKTVQSLCIENTGFSSINTTSAYSLPNIHNISLSHNNIGNVVLLSANGTCYSSVNQTVCLRLPNNIRTLHLSSCNVNRITLEEGLCLEELDLSSNTIPHLGEELVKLSLLRRLNIGSNPLLGICENCYSWLATLETLILDNINLAWIRDFLDNISSSSCKYLSMSVLILSYQSDSKIRFINVSSNVIEDMKDIQIYPSSHLTLLDVRGNPLTSLSRSSLNGVDENTKILFSSTCN